MGRATIREKSIFAAWEVQMLAFNDWRRDQLVEPQDEKEEIRTRAYELYEQRGRQPGRALDDWLTAEREIKASKRWVPPQLGAA